MEIAQALQIVLALARQNVLTVVGTDTDSQIEAIEMLELYALEHHPGDAIAPTVPMANLPRKDADPHKITVAQWEAIRRKYERNPDGAASFLEFCYRVQPAVGIDCLMLPWCGMWLGIELDGHTHS